MLAPVLAARKAAGEGLKRTAWEALKQEVKEGPMTALAHAGLEGFGMPGELASVAKPALNIAKKLVTTPEAKQLGARALESAAEGVAGLVSRPGLVGSLAAPAVSAATEQGAPKLSPAEKIQNLARTNPHQLGAYGPILANALQRGGQKEYDGRVFLLGQTDPGFQQLQQDLAKESQ